MNPATVSQIFTESMTSESIAATTAGRWHTKEGAYSGFAATKLTYWTATYNVISTRQE
jgi:hypothetical protein